MTDVREFFHYEDNDATKPIVVCDCEHEPGSPLWFAVRDFYYQTDLEQRYRAQETP